MKSNMTETKGQCIPCEALGAHTEQKSKVMNEKELENKKLLFDF